MKLLLQFRFTFVTIKLFCSVYLACLVSICNSQINVTCPSIGETYFGMGRLDTIDPIKRISDTSGLAFSPSQVSPVTGAPIVYGIGDKGDGERLFIWDSSTGERLLTLKFDIRVVFNQDFEDITAGSCGHAEERMFSCIYIGDFGANTAGDSGGTRDGRDGVPTRIIKMLEPNLEDFEDQATIPTSYYSILEFDYRHESSPTEWANCETMFLDHTGWGSGGAVGDIYLVTKWGGNPQNPNADFFTKTRLFKIPASVWPTSTCASISTYSPEAVGDYDAILTEGENGFDVTGGQLFGKEWRSGDMSLDGTMIGLGTREDAHIFLRCPGESVADALAAPNASTTFCLIWPHPTGNAVESFAFSPDGSSSLQVPEGHRPRLGWTALEFELTTNETITTCPESTIDVNPVLLTTPPTDNLALCPTFSPTMSPAPSQPPTTMPSKSHEPTLRHSKSPTFLPTISSEPTLSDAPSTVVVVPTMMIAEPSFQPSTMINSAQPSTATNIMPNDRITQPPTTTFPSLFVPTINDPSNVPTTLSDDSTVPTTTEPTTTTLSSDAWRLVCSGVKNNVWFLVIATVMPTFLV